MNNFGGFMVAGLIRGAWCYPWLLVLGSATTSWAQGPEAPAGMPLSGDIPGNLYYLEDETASGERPRWMEEAFPLVDPKAVPGESARSSPGPREVHEPVNLVVTKPVDQDRERMRGMVEQMRQEQAQRPFVPEGRCEPGDEPVYRKRLAVAGFSVQHPEQASMGGLFDAGERLSAWLYQEVRSIGWFDVLAAPLHQTYASLESAPSRFQRDNRLTRYSAVSREMGVQFVVSGVIRDIALNHPAAWDTPYQRRLKTALFAEDTNRRLVADMVVHDGFTGQVLLERRYEARGQWQLGRTEQVTFGGDRFRQTEYGVAVGELVASMAEDLTLAIACQPMLIPIREVQGRDLVLDVGSQSGLAPGQTLTLLRAQRSMSAPSDRPRLWDTGVEATLESVALDRSVATMVEQGGINNIQRGDYAVVR